MMNFRPEKIGLILARTDVSLVRSPVLPPIVILGSRPTLNGTWFCLNVIGFLEGLSLFSQTRDKFGYCYSRPDYILKMYSFYYFIL